MNHLTTQISPPFVLGYALQEYYTAEMGIIAAKEANYSHWYIDGSLESEVPSQWTTARIDSLLEDIAQYQVKPIFHGNFKVPLAADVLELRKAAIDYTKKEIDLAALLGAPVIIHGSVIVEPRLVNKLKKIALDHYIETIEILTDYAAKKNVEIYLENLSNYKNYKPFHYIFTHMEEFEYVFSKLADLKFFLDVGHANIGGGDAVEIIQRHHHRIVAMSFSNNDGMRDQHLSLNNGTIDYKKIISTILNCRWQGIIAFETRGCSPTQSVHDLFYLYQQAIHYPSNSKEKECKRVIGGAYEYLSH